MIYKLVMNRWNGDELIEDVPILETNSLWVLHEAARACRKVCELTGVAGYEFPGLVNLEDDLTAENIAKEIMNGRQEI